MTDEERKERLEDLQRYEDARRKHLSGAIKLVFGLSTGALAFCVLRIVDKDSVFFPPGSSYLVAASAAFAIAVLLSIVTTVARLWDFRLTARKIRRELRGAGDHELESLEKKMDCLGTCTWALFYAQLGSFGVGIVLLMLAMWSLYHGKLFP